MGTSGYEELSVYQGRHVNILWEFGVEWEWFFNTLIFLLSTIEIGICASSFDANYLEVKRCRYLALEKAE